MTAKQFRAAFEAAVAAAFPEPKLKGRGRPKKDRGEDADFKLALEIALKTLEYGKEWGDQNKAIGEVLGVNVKNPTEADQKAIHRAEKALQRRPVLPLAEHEHQLKVMSDEIKHRLRNVPQERMDIFKPIPMVTLLGVLRQQQIDGNFPLELLDDNKVDLLSTK